MKTIQTIKKTNTRTRSARHLTHDEIVSVPFRDLLQAMGLTQAECSRRFGVPLRTVQNWASEAPGNHRECPSYVRLMMAELIQKEKAEA